MKKTPDLVKDFYDQDIDFKALLAAKKSSRKVQSFSLDPYTGPFEKAQKRHLLNRTLVGNAKRHMDDVAALDLDQTIDLLFVPDHLGEPINNYYHKLNAQQYRERYGSEDVAPGAPFIHRAYNRDLPPGNEEQFGGERYHAVTSWYHERIYEQRTSIHWKLFLFLHHLVPVKGFDFFGHKATFNYMKLLFDSCFGSYKQFIYDITIDSSMLNYLNLALSQKDTPDENYAREVQELFTVGKRPFAQFSESDVREIARALVGWNHNYDALVFEEGHEETSYFQPWNHDTGDKHFSSFYSNTVIRGRAGEEGAEELAEVIDMLFDTEESSIYIARRLYQFFVYPNLTDTIEEQIIRPLAEVFRNSNYSLVATLRVLLTSQHFFDQGNYNAMILPPYDYLFKLAKETQILQGLLVHWDGQTFHNELSEPQYFPSRLKDQLVLRSKALQDMTWSLYNMGMVINDPPSVSGWPAFYQAPVYDLFWINTSTIKARKRIAESILRWGVWLNEEINASGSANLQYHAINFLRTFQNPYDIDAFIDELNDRFLGEDLPPATRQRIRRAFLRDVQPEHWEDAMRHILTNESNPYTSGINGIMSDALYLYCMLGEFHLH